MLDIFVGRQPIFDRNLEVIGYEMLFRSGDRENLANVLDDEHATSQVLSTLLEMGLDQLAGQHLVFINVTRGFLLATEQMPLPRSQVVLEVLERVTVDAPLVEAVSRLARQGYRIALDDFQPHQEPLIQQASFIKLDLRQVSRAELAEQVAWLKPRGIKLLAEKVETMEEFTFCRDLGMDYFQGFFLCKPNVLKGQRLPANRMMLLNLMANLHDPHIPVKRLEELVTQDVSLSYKLLRLINSAFYGFPSKIRSIHHTLVLLGIHQIRALVNMLLLTGIDDKPNELMVTAMVRAQMSDRLARGLGYDDPHTHFTIGLFSTLDALMDLPMKDVLALLPLADEINQALLEQAGPAGAILRTVLAYERADWDEVDRLGLEPAIVRQAYLESIQWAENARDLKPRGAKKSR